MNVLLLSQVFYPDVAAVAQYVGNLGEALAARKHNVTVLASSRGYDDPTRHYHGREVWKGVNVRRVPVLGLGKKGKLRRVLSFLSFFVSCTIPLLTIPRQDVVVVLSVPPLLATLAALFVKLRGGRLVYWVMDLNPDEAIAAGWMTSHSLPARVLEFMSCFSMRVSSEVVVLDRFMKQRIHAKGIPEAKVHVIPPWPYDQLVMYDPSGREALRASMNWQDKFVVMHAGNHSPLHPLDNLLEAALSLRDYPGIVFVFSGGGSRLPVIKQFAQDHGLKNIEVYSYRPIEELPAMLSSGDLHVVALGEPFVGIVHPSKIYNMLTIGKPILYIGPEESHISDMRRLPGIRAISHSLRHGDVTSTISVIEKLVADFHAAGTPARYSHEDFSAFTQDRLMAQMIGVVTGKYE